MNLERLLIEKIENRVLVGIICFTAMMVVVGWVAINEPARMSAFSAHQEARAVERGAYLFNQNCSSCHGVDGYGLTGNAPALNNPHLFGFDFGTGALYAEIAELETALDDDALSAEQRTELETRLTTAQGELDALLVQLQPAIDRGYDPVNPERMKQVNWQGGLESYVYTTLVHGRPTSSSYWPQPMAAWSERAGGPLREDQLQYLTDYILNWEREWTVDDLFAVQQFAKVPADPANVVVASDEPGVGTDIDEILVNRLSITGDPINGQQLYTSYACAGCHAGGLVAPLTEETWLNAVAGADGRPSADNPVAYIVQSIVAPNAYIVPGYNAGQMPQDFGSRIKLQELADILAYLQSYDA